MTKIEKMLKKLDDIDTTLAHVNPVDAYDCSVAIRDVIYVLTNYFKEVNNDQT